MTIKIKAPRAWHLNRTTYPMSRLGADPVRIVRESDWRKLMKLVRAVDEHDHADPSKVCDICDALAALEKKK